MPRPTRTRPPLDTAALERLALRYVERFATTRARLAAYLERKLGERGWDGESRPDTREIAERMAERGYIDDRAYAEQRAGAMLRRGLGGRRVVQALRHHGIESDDMETAREQIADGGFASALAFARKRRIGPFAGQEPDRPQREKHVAAMVRAGHPLEVARKIASMKPGEEIDETVAPDGY